MFFYQCIMEQLHDPEVGIYTSFGIAVYSAADGRKQKLRSISDISLNPAPVRQLAELCTSGQLDPAQLPDVVENALAGGLL